jgi:hypothetical protein
LHFCLNFFSLRQMTFLNPFVLFGLAAASIPLLLHLLSQRRLRTVEFSSVRFLKELQRTSMRRLRFRQILLLILRTLLIASLVLAFSRPALRGSLAAIGGADASSTTVIVIDDSPSMMASDEHGPAFARARLAALRMIGLLQEGDRVYLIPLSETRPGGDLPAPRTSESARKVLEEISPSFITVPFRSALSGISTLLESSTDANREIVFITDGQASQFDPAGVADTTFRMDPAVRVYMLTNSLSRAANLSVESAEIQTKILSPARAVRIRARIGNKGDETTSRVLASVYLEGKRVAQQEVSIPPRGAITQDFSFIPKRTGILAGSVRLEDDPYEPDNSWNFALNIPDRNDVLLVGPTAEATRLPSLALSAGGDSTASGHFAIRRITEAELSAIDLSRFDAVIFCGVQTTSTPMIQTVLRFLASGGGVILFPGASADAFAQFAAGLGLPPPARQPVTQAAGSFLTFANIDFAHPILEGMFEVGQSRKPVVEPPHVVTFVPLGRSSASTPVISLSNGSPFLAEYTSQRGRVLAFSVEAALKWSDFPMKGLFAPLLHRAVSYVTSENAGPPSFTAGDPLRVSLQLKEFTDKDIYTLSAPDGGTQRLVPTFPPATSEAVFSGGTARLPGVYTLARTAFGQGNATRKILAVAVNVPRQESDLHSATEDAVRKFSTSMGISGDHFQVMPGDETAVDRVREDRFGVELWRVFLSIAFACAIAEMLVGRSRAKETPA